MKSHDNELEAILTEKNAEAEVCLLIDSPFRILRVSVSYVKVVMFYINNQNDNFLAVLFI